VRVMKKETESDEKENGSDEKRVRVIRKSERE
jgi:hypothetical protein